MKKWKCSPEVKKKILELVKYHYNSLKREKFVAFLALHYGNAIGNLQTAYVMDCMTWELFTKYHDLIYAVYAKKKKELTGMV